MKVVPKTEHIGPCVQVTLNGSPEGTRILDVTWSGRPKDVRGKDPVYEDYDPRDVVHVGVILFMPGIRGEPVDDMPDA